MQVAEYNVNVQHPVLRSKPTKTAAVHIGIERQLMTVACVNNSMST